MEFQIILMTIVTFSAVISVLSFAFSLLLSPVKQNQDRMEKEIASVQKDINTLKEDVSAIKQAVLKNTA